MARSGTERQFSKVLIDSTMPSSTLVMAGTPLPARAAVPVLLVLRSRRRTSSPM